MPDKILGLDIGDTTMKAVQITGGLKGIQVTACSEIAISPNEDMKSALDKLLEDIPVNGSSCTTSLSSGRMSFRNLLLPFKDRKKIEQTLHYELEPLLPFPVEAVTTSYVVAEGNGHTPVFAACIKDDFLAQHLALLQTYAFDPDIVEVGDAAIVVQLMKQEDSAHRVVLLDIGGKTSSVSVCLNGAAVLIRSFHFGGDQLTKAIAESQEIPFDKAETLKLNSKVGPFTNVVRPPIQSFCRDIQNTLHAFRSQVTPEAIPEIILLTGGGALFPDLPPLLEEALGVPVQLLDLSKKNKLEFEKNAADHWNPLTMNNALALALRDGKAKNSFNLRTEKFKKKHRFEKVRGEIKRIAIYISAVFLILCAQFGADYYVLNKQKDHMEGKIKSVFTSYVPDVQKIVNPIQQMQIKIREAKEAMLLPDDAVIQRSAVDILKDVSLRIPKTANLDLSTLVIDEDKVRLKGLTDTFNTVDAIKTGVQESEFFKEVTIASAQQDATTNMVRFEIVMVIK